jgi:hypothetical protein
MGGESTEAWRAVPVGDKSASTSIAPELLHRGETPSSLHRKLRAKLVTGRFGNMEETWLS